MKIGYARVSTYEQTLDSQLDALKVEGCDPIYTDKVSGMKERRPNWEKAFEYAREGDTIVTWRLDRIGRGHTDLLKIVEEMDKRKINLKTLTGIQVDTSTATGRMLFRIMSAFIEYERDQLRERTLAGLAAARARGRLGGRKPLTKDSKTFIRFKSLVEHRGPDNKLFYEVPEICQMMGISRNTYYRWKRFMEAPDEGTTTP
jgi:DNA invertase Pin-like site-specific DNA recombinase